MFVSFSKKMETTIKNCFNKYKILCEKYNESVCDICDSNKQMKYDKKNLYSNVCFVCFRNYVLSSKIQTVEESDSDSDESDIEDIPQIGPIRGQRLKKIGINKKYKLKNVYNFFGRDEFELFLYKVCEGKSFRWVDSVVEHFENSNNDHHQEKKEDEKSNGKKLKNQHQEKEDIRIILKEIMKIHAKLKDNDNENSLIDFLIMVYFLIIILLFILLIKFYYF